MSYDWNMEIDAGGLDPVRWGDLNYTYNVGPMFYQALGKRRMQDDISGMTGEKLIPILRAGIKDMQDRPEFYKKMNPDNKWGDYSGALDVLHTLLRWCLEAPNATLRVT